MELKEQFKKYLEILIKNDKAYNHFEVHTNLFCKEQKYNCEKENYCDKCRRKCKLQADVILTNCVESKLYNFNKPDGINTHEEMFSELDKANEFIMKDTNSNYNYYKKQEDLLQYAQCFFKDVVDKYKFKIYLSNEEEKEIDINLLPIKLNCDYSSKGNPNDNSIRTGNFIAFGRQNIIEINYVQSIDFEDLKKTIRHEVLHYILYILMIDHQDDKGVFHFLCNVHDAEAYKPMNEEQTDIYNKLLLVYNILNKYKALCLKANIKFTENLSKIIMLAGSGEESRKNDFYNICEKYQQLYNNDIIFREDMEKYITIRK